MSQGALTFGDGLSINPVNRVNELTNFSGPDIFQSLDAYNRVFVRPEETNVDTIRRRLAAAFLGQRLFPALAGAFTRNSCLFVR
jgi:hypothetical protein